MRISAPRQRSWQHVTSSAASHKKEFESVDDYAASLRTASVQCEFGVEIEVRLWDQLLLGLKSEAIRKRIMERDKISFADALNLAFDLERITRKVKLGAKAESPVSMVRNSTSKSLLSRLPIRKNFTSKQPLNNTSSTGTGQWTSLTAADTG